MLATKMIVNREKYIKPCKKNEMEVFKLGEQLPERGN